MIRQELNQLWSNNDKSISAATFIIPDAKEIIVKTRLLVIDFCIFFLKRKI